MGKMPMKTRVLEWCILNDRPVAARELFDILKDEYPGERSASVKRIEVALDTYCRLGFLKPAEISQDGDELVVKYHVTEAGKKEIKYIPGHGNKIF